MSDTLDLGAICTNHVEGPQRRWPNAHSTCRACGQVWPCDASRLVTELVLLDTRFAVMPSGSTVLVRVASNTTSDRAAALKTALVNRRPDIDWLILACEEIVGFTPDPNLNTQPEL